MSIDINLVMPLFVLGTFLVGAITVLISGPRLFKTNEWPIVARTVLISVICLQYLWSFAALFRVVPTSVGPWIALVFASAWWPGIIHVWRKRLPTDKPLFHVPPVGTTHPIQKSVAAKENTEA